MIVSEQFSLPVHIHTTNNDDTTFSLEMSKSGLINDALPSAEYYFHHTFSVQNHARYPTPS
jgi:hypothetical protein